jgi:hypothetical protein
MVSGGREDSSMDNEQSICEPGLTQIISQVKPRRVDMALILFILLVGGSKIDLVVICARLYLIQS